MFLLLQFLDSNTHYKSRFYSANFFLTSAYFCKGIFSRKIKNIISKSEKEKSRDFPVYTVSVSQGLARARVRVPTPLDPDPATLPVPNCARDSTRECVPTRTRTVPREGTERELSCSICVPTSTATKASVALNTPSTSTTAAKI